MPPRAGLWTETAGEKVQADYVLPSPGIEERATLGANLEVVSLAALARMKLMANRDQDRVHLRDMIDVIASARAVIASVRDAIYIDDGSSC